MSLSTIGSMERTEGCFIWEKRLVRTLRQHRSTRWWLGYIDGGTGGTKLSSLRPEGSRLYTDWPYLLVQADLSRPLTGVGFCLT
jgi:hypothetical protein